MIKARKAYGDRVILDDVTLSFLPGAKIGVVGPNGMGKSTLLKIMAGLDTVSNGEAYLTPGFTVGILQQEPPLDDTKTVGENIKMAFGPIAEKVARFNQISPYWVFGTSLAYYFSGAFVGFLGFGWAFSFGTQLPQLVACFLSLLLIVWCSNYVFQDSYPCSESIADMVEASRSLSMALNQRSIWRTITLALSSSVMGGGSAAGVSGSGKGTLFLPVTRRQSRPILSFIVTAHTPLFQCAPATKRLQPHAERLYPSPIFLSTDEPFA